MAENQSAVTQIKGCAYSESLRLERQEDLNSEKKDRSAFLYPTFIQVKLEREEMKPMERKGEGK